MNSLYRFGEFVLDPRKRSLSCADSDVSLTPKAFDVLLFLAQNPRRLVTKDELLQGVWGDTFVEEGNLKQYISHLRKALGDNSDHPRMIVTIPRKGYQFTLSVTVVDAAGIAKQATLLALASENSPVKTVLAVQAVSKATKHWRNVTVVGVSAVLLAAGITSWRSFQPAAPRRPQKIMLAILPFKNLTGDTNKEYLADGLTEETISRLGQLNPEQLGVIARTSVMGYKNKDERLDQIGRDLAVQFVLENSIRVSGDHVRLTAQLIQVKDQTHVWSKDYDYPAKDVLNMEDEVANAVAREIRVRLTRQEQTDLTQSHQLNPEAFNAYLQGYYYFERDSVRDTNMAAKYFERATQLDPNYALAWVGLSRARNWQAITGLIPSDQGHQLAREAVERALALNANLGEAHAQMGRLKRQVDFDWAGADASFRRAVELEPGNPESLQLMAASALSFGRFDEALQLAHRALDLDPLNAASWDALGEIEFDWGKLGEAEADLKKAHELRPDDFLSSVFLSKTYVMDGRAPEALPEIERVGYDWVRTFLYALAYHALGRERESDTALRDLIAKYQAIAPYQIAEVYAFRNQPDAAFEWLNQTYPKHDDVIFMKVDPLLKSLHDDP
jgi:TolB-like protein/DNA-binding winged helix-turn-helix (wHTH) protein/Tfp pilus assembly protein PilF